MDIDFSKLPDQEEPKAPPPQPKVQSGAGGSFAPSLGESFESKLIKHPNLYGVYGAVAGTAEELTKFSYLKYIYPEEREEFWNLTTDKQTRRLLLDNLEAVAGLGGGRAAGFYLKKLLPGTYNFLTKPLFKKSAKELSKAKAEGAKVMDMIRERRAGIDIGMLRSGAFISKIERNLSTRELEAIPYIIEGIKDPNVLTKIGRKDLIPFVKSPSKKASRIAEIVGKYYETSHQFLKDNWGDIGFVKDYVTHIWDIPKGRKSEVVNFFATKNPFLRKRSIPTLEDGIKLGLKPKTTNIAELLRVYDQYKIKTVYNFKLAQQLKNAVSEDGAPLIMRADKAPRDWVKIDHPALNRVMMTGKIKKQVPVKESIKTIKETIQKIKTIERTISRGGDVAPSAHRQIHALEGIIEDALKSRGMTSGEASNYLNKMRRAYAGAEVEGRAATERVSEEVARSTVESVTNEIKKKFSVDIPVLSTTPAMVDPAIAREVKIITDQPFSHPAIQAFETVNAFLKKGMLSLSFFHHHALTESAFATGIGGKTTRLIKPWNPVKVIRAIRRKDYAIFKEQPLAEDGIQHGLTFGALEDVHRTAVQKSLLALERRARNIPGLNVATRGLRKGNDLWDAALWDYYHNTLKLWAYEKNVVDGLRGASQRLRRDLTPEEITAVKREMAGFVNDSFGGQNWDMKRMLGNPKVRQMLHWGLLAPDWTLSVLRQATAPARGVLKGGVEGKALAGRGADFWMKAGLYFNLIAQSANYYNTENEYGKGRFTWQNPPGNALNIFIGRNPDGTERYMRMGKQFREALEWGLNPIDKIGAKMSPLARETIRQINAHDPGSGYPTEWAEKEGLATIPERLKSIAEMPLPFSLRPYVESRPGVFMFTFPTKKGMTNWKAVDLFKKALKSGKIDQVKRIYVSALENNLDAQALFRSANSAIKADITYDNKKIARELLLELKGLDSEAYNDALRLYRDRGTITPKVALEMDKLLRKQIDIQQQKTNLGIKGQ